MPSGLGCGFEDFRSSPDVWAHKTWAASVDLYNESHLDSGDGERCWAVWTRAHPQLPARGQAALIRYLLFPDVGLAIELTVSQSQPFSRASAQCVRAHLGTHAPTHAPTYTASTYTASTSTRTKYTVTTCTLGRHEKSTDTLTT